MKVLVTGACGFIGINLCERLLNDGHEVIGFDNFSGEYAKSVYKQNQDLLENSDKALFVRGDINDKKAVSFLKGKGITHVVHLAAKTGVRDSVLHPREYIETNIIGTQNILDFAVAENVSSIVLASTSSVYGKNIPPFDESMPTTTPLSPYAATKIGMESLAYSYNNLSGLPINILRFFTVYGPKGRTDMAVYKFTKLINDGKPITVFGDGSAKRDFTYVDDIVEGIISAMKLKAGFNVFNLGYSKKITINEVILLIEKNLGKKAIVKHVGFHAEDALETLADITKAKKVLGYSPKTSVDDGIRFFVDWFRKNA
ncbi:MAG: SDR family NAD(P)-dependent oxidoreductase [Candidatus Diapherotrites archaeon]